MSMSDPIADLLTRIRNAVQAGQAIVECPASGLKSEVCRVLKAQGYIRDYYVEDEPVPGRIRITLKYLPDRSPVLRGLHRISRPSLRVYVKAKEIRPVRSGLGICIVSTSRGVMTGGEARQQGVGGEVLCEVW
jgi:small subunit ribosomal protein S8